MNERGNEACFEEMDSSDTFDFEVLDRITADKWEEGFDEEINSALFNTGTGPLWRVRLLRETLVDGKSVAKCVGVHISTCYLRRALHLRASEKGARVFKYSTQWRGI